MKKNLLPITKCNGDMMEDAHGDDLLFIDKDVSEVLTTPKVIIVNKFSEKSLKEFSAKFSEAENTGQTIIPIYIDSLGGDVYSLLAMIDIIKSSKAKIATIAIGKAMSCGSVLLSQGAEGYRFSSPLATIMIHDGASVNHGKTEELKANANEMDRLEKITYSLMDSGTGNAAGYFNGIVHSKGRADWYLTAEDALQHRLINHIGVPRFNVAVKTTINFG